MSDTGAEIDELGQEPVKTNKRVVYQIGRNFVASLDAEIDQLGNNANSQ